MSRWLVGSSRKQDLRRLRQGAGDMNTLALAARERLPGLCLAIGHVDPARAPSLPPPGRRRTSPTKRSDAASGPAGPHRARWTIGVGGGRSAARRRPAATGRGAEPPAMSRSWRVLTRPETGRLRPRQQNAAAKICRIRWGRSGPGSRPAHRQATHRKRWSCPDAPGEVFGTITIILEVSRDTG